MLWAFVEASSKSSRELLSYSSTNVNIA